MALALARKVCRGALGLLAQLVCLGARSIRNAFGFGSRLGEDRAGLGLGGLERGAHIELGVGLQGGGCLGRLAGFQLGLLLRMTFELLCLASGFAHESLGLFGGRGHELVGARLRLSQQTFGLGFGLAAQLLGVEVGLRHQRLRGLLCHVQALLDTQAEPGVAARTELGDLSL